MNLRWTYQWILCLRGKHQEEGCRCLYCSYRHPVGSVFHVWTGGGCTCEICGLVRKTGHAYDDWRRCTRCKMFHPDADICDGCHGTGIDLAACIGCSLTTSSAENARGSVSRLCDLGPCPHKESEGFKCEKCDGHGAARQIRTRTVVEA